VRRTVGPVTLTRQKYCISFTARVNGIQIPKRVIPSYTLGVKCPANNCSSSSRGEKPRLTLGAHSIAAFQVDDLVRLRCEFSRLLPAWLQRRPALGTQRTFYRFSFPCRGSTDQGGVFQHPGSQAGQSLIQGYFDLSEGRLGVLHSPFFHAGYHVFR
jgi:hypothetical protein